MIGQNESPPDHTDTPQAPIADAAEPPPPNAEPAGIAATGGAAVEVGGRDGPEPTRYGDWEKNGRCIDF